MIQSTDSQYPLNMMSLGVDFFQKKVIKRLRIFGQTTVLILGFIKHNSPVFALFVQKV